MLALPGPAIGQSSSGSEILDVVFSEIEKRIIEEYFGVEPADEPTYGSKKKEKKGESSKGKGKSGDLPPGLAKRKELPPGLAKRSALPPGLARRELPADLASRLPPPPEDTERLIIDDRLVLVEKATGVVLDILEHVFAGSP